MTGTPAGFQLSASSLIRIRIPRTDYADAMVRKFVMRTGQLDLGHVAGYTALFRNPATLARGSAH